MTIAQLKRHMDRRFAMTNKRLQRCATKEDLQRFATKEDLADLDGRMNRGFGEVMRRLDSLNEKMDSLFRSTNARMDRLIGALDVKVVDRDRIVDNHENRLCDLEAQARH